MKDQVLNALNQMLANNLGNKLTPELANGILNTMNQVLMQTEPPKESE
jgi:hypothetical protein